MTDRFYSCISFWGGWAPALFFFFWLRYRFCTRHALTLNQPITYSRMLELLTVVYIALFSCLVRQLFLRCLSIVTARIRATPGSFRCQLLFNLLHQTLSSGSPRQLRANPFSIRIYCILIWRRDPCYPIQRYWKPIFVTIHHGYQNREQNLPSQITHRSVNKNQWREKSENEK